MTDFLQRCRDVKNFRTLKSTFKHGEGEMTELFDEIYGHAEGPDGIVGEAVDVILCMMDIIAQHDPDMTMERLKAEFIEPKFAKWVAIYGEKE